MAHGEFPKAQALLRDTIAVGPHALWPRVVLSHALIQEGRDLDAAEQALRDVLALDPGNAEARNNLAVLLRNRERGAADQVFAGTAGDRPAPKASYDSFVADTRSDAAMVWERASEDEAGNEPARRNPHV